MKNYELKKKMPNQEKHIFFISNNLNEIFLLAAEQITLLDAQLFWRLEPGELLIWAAEQNEEKCPNLAKFTKHFNAMSYWCR